MTVLKCKFCNKQFQRTHTFTRHNAVCSFIQISSKEKTLMNEYNEKQPSIETIYNIVVNLCIENNKLKNRIEQLEKNNFINKKKNIEDYLSTIPKDIIHYSDWINQLVVSDENLQVLFASNIIECMKSILETSFLLINVEKTPLRAFTQKSQTIYIFENDIWKPVQQTEFNHFVSILCHRILKKYLEWKKINQENIDSNEKLQELDIQYMQKASGCGKTTEQRATEMKKWIFSKIQKSLKNVEKES
jgi:hypothetical protein